MSPSGSVRQSCAYIPLNIVPCAEHPPHRSANSFAHACAARNITAVCKFDCTCARVIRSVGARPVCYERCERPSRIYSTALSVRLSRLFAPFQHVRGTWWAEHISRAPAYIRDPASIPAAQSPGETGFYLGTWSLLTAYTCVRSHIHH